MNGDIAVTPSPQSAMRKPFINSTAGRETNRWHQQWNETSTINTGAEWKRRIMPPKMPQASG
jgi:hypothetical protein